MITFSFKDKVVLITGANGAVGSATVDLFHKSGATVVGVPHTDMEIADKESVQRVVNDTLAKYKKIDFLVNTVGVYVDGDEWNLSEEAWKKTLETNLLGAMYLSKAVGQHFVERKQGVMVHIASRMGVYATYDSLAYSASKAGLISLVQAYARLLAPFGRANAISPSAIMAGYWLRAPKEEIEENQKRNPMKQYVKTEDVAALAAYLCSDEATMITGQNICIDGGYSFR